MFGTGQNFTNQHILINDSSFEDCFTTESGGAIEAENSNIMITKSNFFFNVATEKGVSILSDNCNLNISDSNFTQSASEEEGGAIYAHAGSIDIYDCIFTQVDAESSGAISFDSVHVSIDLCGFISNEVEIHTSALHLQNCDGSITTSLFANNSCHSDFNDEDGCVFITTYVNKPLNISLCVFLENTYNSKPGFDLFIVPSNFFS